MKMRDCSICKNTDCSKLFTLTLSQPDKHILNSTLNVFYCERCIFHFTSSSSSELDYTKYYLTNNNYKVPAHYNDKDEKCYTFLCNNLENVNTIIDYGCGNGELSDLLSSNYKVTKFDIGLPDPTEKYDCLVLSHVLEHVYNPENFINKISKYISPNQYMYIEVPNAQEYDKMQGFGYLQEINVEHINFFSAYALSKLMINCGFTPVNMSEDFFMFSNMKHYVIRGIFKKSENSLLFEKYISEGSNYLNTIVNSLPEIQNRVFLYGCGQLLYKLIDKLQQRYTITYVIDNNINLKGKNINSIKIISLEDYVKIYTESDTLIITSKQHSVNMIKQINNINRNIQTLCV